MAKECLFMNMYRLYLSNQLIKLWTLSKPNQIDLWLELLIGITQERPNLIEMET